MFWFILSIIVLIIGIIAFFVIGFTGIEKDDLKHLNELLEDDPEPYEKRRIAERKQEIEKGVHDKKHYSKIILTVSLILSVLMFMASTVAIVPTGYTGIKTTFGKVEDETMASGINYIMPWQAIVTMDNRTQKVQLDTQAFSSDIQQVDIKLSVNYNIDQKSAQILYKTVGTNYFENVMYPRIQENTKAVFSQYTAESLIEKRNELSAKIAAATSSNMESYGITIVSISIENIDFTDAFTDAVEAKQVAAQKKLTAETEQAQKTMEEEAAAKRAVIAEKAKAEQAIIAANADLEVVRIQAEASLYAGQREAEMNQRISEALTDKLIDYYWIKQWNGELPSTMLDNNPSIMMTLDNNHADTTTD